MVGDMLFGWMIIVAHKKHPRVLLGVNIPIAIMWMVMAFCAWFRISRGNCLPIMWTGMTFVHGFVLAEAGSRQLSCELKFH